MQDPSKTYQELLEENSALKQKISELEQSEVMSICRDITELKHAEEALHKAEREKSAILDAMSEIVIYLDTDMRIVWSNRATNQQFNVTPDQVKGRHCYEVLHKLNRHCKICPVVKAIETGEPHIIDDFSSYGKRWTLRAYPVRNEKDEVIGVVEIVTDISEQKSGRGKTRKLEERMHTLVDTIPDLIWLKDAEGVYLSCNRMFELFFGAKEADIVGKTDYDFVSKELADFFREHDRKAMALGKSSSNEEWVEFTSDGHRALLDTIKTPMYDARGTLIGVLGIGRDITERKRAEEALRESQQQLVDIIEFLPDATMVINKEGKVIAWNRAIEDMTGVRRKICSVRVIRICHSILRRKKTHSHRSRPASGTGNGKALHNNSKRGRKYFLAKPSHRICQAALHIFPLQLRFFATPWAR